MNHLQWLALLRLGHQAATQTPEKRAGALGRGSLSVMGCVLALAALGGLVLSICCWPGILLGASAISVVVLTIVGWARSVYSTAEYRRQEADRIARITPDNPHGFASELFKRSARVAGEQRAIKERGRVGALNGREAERERQERERAGHDRQAAVRRLAPQSKNTPDVNGWAGWVAARLAQAAAVAEQAEALAAAAEPARPQETRAREERRRLREEPGRAERKQASAAEHERERVASAGQPGARQTPTWEAERIRARAQEAEVRIREEQLEQARDRARKRREAERQAELERVAAEVEKIRAHAAERSASAPHPAENAEGPLWGNEGTTAMAESYFAAFTRGVRRGLEKQRQAGGVRADAAGAARPTPEPVRVPNRGAEPTLPAPASAVMEPEPDLRPRCQQWGCRRLSTNRGGFFGDWWCEIHFSRAKPSAGPPRDISRGLKLPSQTELTGE